MAADTAPTADLQRIIDFVNTLDLDDGTDELDTPDALTRWLIRHQLLDAPRQATVADVRQAHALRQSLRDALRAHHDDARPNVGRTNALLAGMPLVVELDAQGGARLVPAGDGTDAALARMIATIPQAIADGTWERTKICPSDTCAWAFYDRSRNRSRRWCSMDVCGNREKSRTFRERSKDGTSPSAAQG